MALVTPTFTASGGSSSSPPMAPIAHPVASAFLKAAIHITICPITIQTAAVYRLVLLLHNVYGDVMASEKPRRSWEFYVIISRSLSVDSQLTPESLHRSPSVSCTIAGELPTTYTD
ncbi:hypothetical protein NUW54_g5111 [Trametes sanguinea]|uniref:Uncharacterized protein n=1 Tax=Trametes sanguinea TaxID=158606 RepID=A0ACC1PXW7_9APHY|nr:hypothetical protein NUW54_g5111 [Trametes sanguinea]